MKLEEDILTDEGKIICNLTNIFANKNREIERLNNIIDVKSAFIQDLLEIIYYSDDNIIHTKAHLLGQEYEDKLKELKEEGNK